MNIDYRLINGDIAKMIHFLTHIVEGCMYKGYKIYPLNFSASILPDLKKNELTICMCK